MKEFNHKKLVEFLENNENRMLIIWFLTLLSYVILFFLFKNTFVLLFSYFIFYLIYSRLYNFVLNKLEMSLKNNDQRSVALICGGIVSPFTIYLSEANYKLLMERQ